MSRVTADIAISLDGYAAGPNQTLEHPFGDGVGEILHDRMAHWMFDEQESKAHAAEIAAITAAKAYVMGRNMFSPGRGEWDLDWKGWWGPNPPYHGPVFVLTHHPRESLTMEGGTTFHFVTDGIESALAQAKTAAGEGDVSIAGGAATLRQYLKAGLVDELRLHIVPIVIGQGENVFTDLQGVQLEPVAVSGTRAVTHVTYHPAAHLTLT
jgi:dihydrofolate reductase